MSVNFLAECEDRGVNMPVTKGKFMEGGAVEANKSSHFIYLIQETSSVCPNTP